MDYEHEDVVDEEGYYDSHDDEDYNTEDDSDTDEYLDSRQEVIVGETRRPVKWVQVKIADQILTVSDTGVIRSGEWITSTKGTSMPGTPYRVYRVDNKCYYVHDIIWRAFNGEPPSGWEVRHKLTQKRSMYDNALHKLIIVPIQVEHNPTLFPV
jgi:hypothetical protein